MFFWQLTKLTNQPEKSIIMNKLHKTFLRKNHEFTLISIMFPAAQVKVTVLSFTAASSRADNVKLEVEFVVADTWSGLIMTRS